MTLCISYRCKMWKQLSAIGFVWSLCTAIAVGQARDRHFTDFADLPPGTIGKRALERGGPLRGYFQPVELMGPEGSHVSLVVDGQFQDSDKASAKAGMLIGEVYRARVTNIPGHAGFEVYPTVEVINRLYPPPGQETRFPIPIEISEDDLKRVLEGEFVVRIVFLEDPRIALPVSQKQGEQRSIDAGPGNDPLIAADKLGRPMAIVRIGARIPDEIVQGQPGLYSPPIQLYNGKVIGSENEVKQTSFEGPVR